MTNTVKGSVKNVRAKIRNIGHTTNALAEAVLLCVCRKTAHFSWFRAVAPWPYRVTSVLAPFTNTTRQTHPPVVQFCLRLRNERGSGRVPRALNIFPEFLFLLGITVSVVCPPWVNPWVNPLWRCEVHVSRLSHSCHTAYPSDVVTPVTHPS